MAPEGLTTYLDLTHQIDVLDLVVDLNRREGRTVVIPIGWHHGPDTGPTDGL